MHREVLVSIGTTGPSAESASAGPGAPSASDDLRAYDDGSWLEQGLYCPSCGRWVAQEEESSHQPMRLSPRLWVYTNYDCNLACSYCLVSSSPYAERRAISTERFTAMMHEGRLLGIREVFLTGGEPFLLPNIFEMLALSCQLFPTTVLSNAMLMKGKRLEQLAEIRSPNLAIQVSLDDDHPGEHDAYRGEGSFQRTIEGIRALQSIGVRVRIATTVTPVIAERVDALRAYVRDELSIAEADHIVRPLLKRGFSEEGLAVGKDDLAPELTVDLNGVYWHPAGTDADLLITTDTSSLRGALDELARQTRARSGSGELQPFR